MDRLPLRATIADLEITSITDIEVTLGSAELSSTCRIVTSDPLHELAAKMINHTIQAGGIQGLKPAAAPKTPTPPGSPATDTSQPIGEAVGLDGAVARGADFDATTLAFLDTICKREVSQPLSIQGYYSQNGPGYFNDADIKAGGGFPRSAGTTQNVGRYQVNRGDWSDAKKADSRIQGFSPREQDLVALYKLKYVNRGWKQLRSGDLEAALKQASNEWVSIPWNTKDGQVQAGTTKQEYLEYYKTRLLYHKGSLKEQQTTATVNTANSGLDGDTSTDVAAIKGSPLTVYIGDRAFEFIHQATELTSDGLTTISGQGVRWIVSRQKQNKTYQGLSLKELAEKICISYKLKLDYQSSYNPTYSHIDQSGISDYKLLAREVEESGLMITEKDGTVVIADRQSLKDSKLVLARGKNLVSYIIRDAAVGIGDDDLSKVLANSAKMDIDPISGTTRNLLRVPGTTGSSKPVTSGSVDNKTKQLENKGKTKRVGGLPSTFVIPLDTSLEPLSTMITTDLPGVLKDRLWVVVKVTHKVSDNTSTISAVSPVDILDTSTDVPPVVEASTPSTSDTPSTSSTRYIYPCSGVVTSTYGSAEAFRSKPHQGADIACPVGTPILAVADGMCVRVAYEEKGAGNYCRIKHAEGAYSGYFHQRDRPLIATGQLVKQGQTIGYVGNTGTSTGAHLHLELLTSLDPPTRVSPKAKLPKLTLKGQQIVAGEKT